MGKTGPKPKTECGKGHPMTGDNVYIRPKGRFNRQCKECRRQQMKRYRERQMKESIESFRNVITTRSRTA